MNDRIISITQNEYDELKEKVAELENRINKALEKLEEIVLFSEYIEIHSDFINDTKAILKGKKDNE